MKDIRQTPLYAKYLSSIGWKVEYINHIYIFIKKIPLLGNIIKIQRPKKLDEELLKKIYKKHKPFQVIIEPKVALPNFRQTGPYLPSKTLVLDLTKSKKELLSEMKNDARSGIIKNSKLVINNLEQKDLEEFRRVWKKSVPLRRYVPSLAHLQALIKSFGNKALFLITADKSSGAIFLIGDETAYYWMAFTNEFGREQKYQYKIVWEGVSWAKTNQCKYFDFEGIYDDRFPNKSWLGFTHFKKSFGGEEIVHPGAYIKTLPNFNIKFSLKSQNWIAITFILIGVLALVLSLTHTSELVEFAKIHPLIAPFLIILWRIIGVVIPPIPGGLLSLAMIPVFGWFQAYLYGAIGLIIGCCIAFYLSRTYGTNLVKNFIPLSQIHRLEKRLSKADHFFAFLIVRFTTGPVMDFASYVAGLTKVKFSTFLLATIISILPDAIYYYLGDAIYRRFSPILIIGIIAVFGSFYILQKLIAKRSKT